MACLFGCGGGDRGQATSIGATYICSDYRAQPIILEIMPNTGSTTGGTQVEINGRAFQGCDNRVRVFFVSPQQRVEATNVRLVSDSKITCTSPTGSGVVSLSVEATYKGRTGSDGGSFIKFQGSDEWTLLQKNTVFTYR